MTLLACGMCVDQAALQSLWWVSAAPLSAMALLLEAFVYAIVMRVRGVQVRHRRKWMILGAFVLGITISFSMMGSGMALFGSITAIVLVDFLWSLAADARVAPRTQLARVGLVLPLLVFAVIPLHPRLRPTEGLIKVVLGGPGHRTTRSEWAEAELLRRPEATGIAKERLAQAGPNDSIRDRNRLLHLAQLTGVDEPARLAFCARAGERVEGCPQPIQANP